MNYSPKTETVTVQCGASRLQIGSERVTPPPYWIKQVGGLWYFDDPGSSIKGDRYEEDKYGFELSRWMSAVLNYLCQ